MLSGARASPARQRAKLGFNCKVLYHNRNRVPEQETELGVEYATKDELLTRSDTVIVIVSTTDVVIDADALKKMKRTASLVNGALSPYVLLLSDSTCSYETQPVRVLTCVPSLDRAVARGPTVDTAALTAALQSGEIASAGLDVIDPEPPATDHPIYSLHNVILAPHRGSATVKTRRAMSQLCLDNMMAGLRGEPLLAQAN